MIQQSLGNLPPQEKAISETTSSSVFSRSASTDDITSITSSLPPVAPPAPVNKTSQELPQPNVLIPQHDPKLTSETHGSPESNVNGNMESQTGLKTCESVDCNIY